MPVEEAIAKAFLPALLQEQNELSENFRSQLALPVRQAGIGIPSPCNTARGHYEASVNCTKVLAQSLLDGTDLDTRAHRAGVREGPIDTTNARMAAAEQMLTSLLADATPAAKRQATRAKGTSA